MCNRANDSTAVGQLGQITNRIAEGNVERLRTVLLEPLLANAGAGQNMADGQPMFHACRGNLAGTGGALDIDTLSDARLAMRRQKGLKGELYAVEPWALVVSPELETQAQKLLAEIDATKFSDANPFSGALELIVEPGLTDPAAWYVCADPSRYDGLAHAFLDGAAAPRIESRAGWNTLGLEFRSVWTLDAKFVETATWYRNPGA
ncbi:MAG: phage major capsid protein [Alkalilacustris sp.]